MKRIVLALILAAAATPAIARIGPIMPDAMEEAPIERAIENISADTTLPPAQRERLLGRFHLIAYAQARAPMLHFGNGEWAPRDSGPCRDRGFQRPSPPYRCPYGFGGMTAAPELPTPPQRVSAEGRRHLRLARTHYQRALALDDTNMRAHLGLAFVLDELGEGEAARTHLRRIIALSDSVLSANTNHVQYWEDTSVLHEAVEHLASLALSPADRADIARLRERLGSAEIVVVVTPIVVPLTDAPFDALTDTRSPVAFDFAGTGDRRAQGWLTADAAWLVWDPNKRGEVHSGFDLIGQRTWAVFWRDGFEAMRSLDDNGDGELAGAELGGLALWRDANANGVSDAGEVLPVTDHGIVGLAVRGDQQRRDLIVAPRGVRFENGRLTPLYDWTPGLSTAPTS